MKTTESKLKATEYAGGISLRHDLGMEPGDTKDVTLADGTLVRVWRSAYGVKVTELTNAGRRGKFCKVVKMFCAAGTSEKRAKAVTDGLLGPTLNYLAGAGPAESNFMHRSGWHVERHLVAGKNVFAHESQLKAVYKPLKEEPKKWTIPHVVRALVNGQADDCRCDNYTSDNDDMDRKRKGPRDAIAFARELVNDPSDWWVLPENDRIVVVRHSYDENSFEFVGAGCREQEQTKSEQAAKVQPMTLEDREKKTRVLKLNSGEYKYADFFWKGSLSVPIAANNETPITREVISTLPVCEFREHMGSVLKRALEYFDGYFLTNNLGQIRLIRAVLIGGEVGFIMGAAIAESERFSLPRRGNDWS